MRYILKGAALKERVLYRGVVNRYKAGSSRLVIFVILDKDPDVEYLKSIKVSTSENSVFAKLAEELALIDEMGCVDTDYLDDLHVLVTLRKGKDDNLYINKIRIDEEYYDELNENEEEE